MNATSITLLDRLKTGESPEDWDRLVDLYGPLISSWARRYEVQPSDADDLVQEVLLSVSRELASFDHNGRTGAFRAWVRTILVNRMRNFWRTRGRQPQAAGGLSIDARLAELEDPGSDASKLWNEEHDRFVMHRLLSQAEGAFTPATWTAFTRVAINGERADTVAADLGMTPNAVFIAKSRVLSRLRQDAAGLLDGASGFSKKP